MAKIYKIVDGQYFEGDLYQITDNGDGKSKIEFSPSQVVTEGTIMDAEKFNEFQKNNLYYVNASHSIDGGKSIYTIDDFEDIDDFGVFQGFKLMLDPPVSSVGGAKIELLGVRYDILKTEGGALIEIESNDISEGLPVTLVYDNGVFKIQNISYETINNKLLNLMYRVGDYYITENSDDPSVRWPGTTWARVDGKMLLGANGAYVAGTEGGASQVTLNVSNMPAHSHTVNNHTHSIPSHTHGYNAVQGDGAGWYSAGGNLGGAANRTTSAGGGGTSGGATASTNSQGSGTAFDILNPYRAVNIWRRVA